MDIVQARETLLKRVRVTPCLEGVKIELMRSDLATDGYLMDFEQTRQLSLILQNALFTHRDLNAK